MGFAELAEETSGAASVGRDCDLDHPRGQSIQQAGKAWQLDSSRAASPRSEGSIAGSQKGPNRDADESNGDGKRPVHTLPWFWIAALLLLLVNWGAVSMMGPASKPRVAVPFSPFFLSEVQAGQVKSISSTGDSVQGTFTKNIRYPADDHHVTPTSLFSTEVPSFWSDSALTRLLQEKGVQVNAQSTSSVTPLWDELLLGFGPTILLVGLFLLVARRAARGGGLSALGNFGRSQARQVDPSKISITFADVAGIDEAKSELTEIVNFLKDPGPYTRLGARVPRGVLLYGAPGTGKTLLARAVAGEANAAYFAISASEFIEGIVGLGAARVRDLFAKAKEAEPSIIFIDELDAIGRSRRGSFSGADDEREQTLDQILTEMDGFETSQAVIVLGATNRPEVLDAALLRPGRFDRRVAVPVPDRSGRQRILAVHAGALPLASDVDLNGLAGLTPGMVGADLANLVNEAALLTARRGKDRVDAQDFADALDKILLGTPRGIVLSPADRKRTAYHESGHALVGMLTPGADPVRQISIVPRGLALGVTLSTPDADKVSYSSQELEAQIKVALGGRVAEELVFDYFTTGAESDIRHLTQIARQMVGRWGMSSEVGPVALLPDDGDGAPNASSDASPQTLWNIDQEVRRLVERAHKEVTQLLSSHLEQLNSLASALLQTETLDAASAYAAAGLDRKGPAPVRKNNNREIATASA
jgi:cell division protease FtsH